MKTVMVVGGAGYIGSHNVRRLKAKGYNVVVYDNLSKGHEESIKGIKFVNGDINDSSLIAKTLVENKVDVVMHFAAFIEVGESTQDPGRYYKNNVVNVIRLLDTMIQNNVKNFVFSSTAAVFGEPVRIPIDEEHQKLPINPYGKTKYMVEEILKDYDAAYGMKYAVLRYFNAAGADDAGDIGESHNPESHLIPLILKTALGERDSIKIFGTDYPTKDGTCIRDFIHVNDLADAHILAVENLLKSGISNNFNLGSGEGFTVKEVIETAKQITGVDFKVEEYGRREGDPSTLIADSEKALKILGWKTKYTLHDIISTAWKWHSNKRY